MAKVSVDEGNEAGIERGYCAGTPDDHARTTVNNDLISSGWICIGRDVRHNAAGGATIDRRHAERSLPRWQGKDITDAATGGSTKAIIPADLAK
jgi:hypothetical protein